jgi:RNA polymerase sigma-70 factor (ECF subfamily)
MNSLTDAQCLGLVANGDQEAFRVLFMRYQPRMKGFIADLVNSESIAEDLAQDVFMRIWDHRKILPAIKSASAYMYRMARNAALDHLKSLRVREVGAGKILRDNPVTPYEKFLAHETELLVGLLVDKMPAQRQKVFKLSRHEGLSNEQIASMLGLSTKTVENHLNLALREIRRLLPLLLLLL